MGGMQKVGIRPGGASRSPSLLFPPHPSPQFTHQAPDPDAELQVAATSGNATSRLPCLATAPYPLSSPSLLVHALSPHLNAPQPVKQL